MYQVLKSFITLINKCRYSDFRQLDFNVKKINQSLLTNCQQLTEDVHDVQGGLDIPAVLSKWQTPHVKMTHTVCKLVKEVQFSKLFSEVFFGVRWRRLWDQCEINFCGIFCILDYFHIFYNIFGHVNQRFSSETYLFLNLRLLNFRKGGLLNTLCYNAVKGKSVVEWTCADLQRRQDDLHSTGAFGHHLFSTLFCNTTQNKNNQKCEKHRNLFSSIEVKTYKMNSSTF